MAKEFVEIAGIKWATMNVGAEKETDTGLYFQWGDAQGYAADEIGPGEDENLFDWKSYKYCKRPIFPNSTDITKYNSVDGKNVLEASDDAVTENWGNDWRMPTRDEFKTLIASVTTLWTDDYKGSGVAGMVCTDIIDPSKVLFFPALGFCFNGSVYNVDLGYYWSSSLDNYYVINAYGLFFDWGNVDWKGYYSRHYGFPVRGVMK